MMYRGIPLTQSLYSGCWEYGGININNTMIIRQTVTTPVHPETVCEFTGVYDSSDLAVYTSDIVLWNDYEWTVEKCMRDTMGYYLIRPEVWANIPAKLVGKKWKSEITVLRSVWSYDLQ